MSTYQNCLFFRNSLNEKLEFIASWMYISLPTTIVNVIVMYRSIAPIIGKNFPEVGAENANVK